MWNLLHAWWQMMPKDKRTPANADAAIRQARKDIDFLAVLAAQAAQAVLKTYLQAGKNCWEGRAAAPDFKARLRSVMSVDIPQGRDLNIARVHRRWGMVNIPKFGRVRFRWTKNLPVGRQADGDNRITGARLVKDALGWHIAFRVQTLAPEPEPHRGPEVGIDVGITVPLALSDGTTYGHGEWLTKSEQARLLRLEQRAARRKKHRKPASDALARNTSAPYPYQTSVVGRSKSGWDTTGGAYSATTPEDGGVTVLSKWPIVRKYRASPSARLHEQSHRATLPGPVVRRHPPRLQRRDHSQPQILLSSGRQPPHLPTLDHTRSTSRESVGFGSTIHPKLIAEHITILP
ncbi:hypothetical protein ACWD6R_27395 [Streptomyces sp. NPDC005151]